MRQTRAGSTPAHAATTHLQPLRRRSHLCQRLRERRDARLARAAVDVAVRRMRALRTAPATRLGKSGRCG